jgi:hypothetical protein
VGWALVLRRDAHVARRREPAALGRSRPRKDGSMCASASAFFALGRKLGCLWDLHHEAQWQQLRGRYVPCEGGPSVPVTSSTQHGHMSGAMPSKPFTRGPGSTWLRSEFSTAVRRTAASHAFDLPQAPHAYAILVDARVQTAGCVASRLHAVADLEVLGKAQLHRRSQ